MYILQKNESMKYRSSLYVRRRFDELKKIILLTSTRIFYTRKSYIKTDFFYKNYSFDIQIRIIDIKIFSRVFENTSKILKLCLKITPKQFKFIHVNYSSKLFICWESFCHPCLNETCCPYIFHIDRFLKETVLCKCLLVM